MYLSTRFKIQENDSLVSFRDFLAISVLKLIARQFHSALAIWIFISTLFMVKRSHLRTYDQKNQTLKTFLSL